MRRGVTQRLARALLGLLPLALPACARVLSSAGDAAGPAQVTSASDLRHHLVRGAQEVHFVNNITLDNTLFPSLESECVKPNSDTEEIRACSSQQDVVIYASEDPQVEFTWTADTGVVLDARFLRRAIVLGSPLRLQKLVIAQLLDDHNPFIFLFSLYHQGVLHIESSSILSPCGGRDAEYAKQALSSILHGKANFTVQDKNVLYFDNSGRFTLTAFATGTVSLKDTSIQCYDPFTADFAPEQAPAGWQPGSAETAVREDECVRPATNGEDYRGTHNYSEKNHTCLFWNSTELDTTRTPALFPLSGLGTMNSSHNYCRNPDSRGQTWCFVSAETGSGQVVREEFCDLPSCDKTGSDLLSQLDLRYPGPQGSAPQPPRGMSTGALLGIVAAACLAFTVLALVVYLLYHLRCCARHDRDTSGIEINKPRLGHHLDMDSVVPFHKHTTNGIGAGLDMRPVFDIGLAQGIQPLSEQSAQVQVMEVIGQGARSMVYRGLWKGQRVAVKTMWCNSASEQALAAAKSRANALKSFVHPFLVTTHDCQLEASGRSLSLGGSFNYMNDVAKEEGGVRVIIVQEYFDGRSLAAAVEEGFFISASKSMDSNAEPTTHKQHVLQVAWQTGIALQYIHNKDAAHGDLTPNNVMLKVSSKAPSKTQIRCKAQRSARNSATYNSLASGFIAKISDFALDFVIPEEPLLDPKRRHAAFYLPPNVKSTSRPSKAADVYALGCVLWEIYHSRPCYQETKQAGLEYHPDFPRFPGSCPLPYAALVCACVKLDDAERPQMDAFVAVLQGALASDDSPRAQKKKQREVRRKGPVELSDNARIVLGREAEAYASSDAWRDVVHELNSIESHPIMELLYKFSLVDLYTMPPPHGTAGGVIPAGRHLHTPSSHDSNGASGEVPSTRSPQSGSEPAHITTFLNNTLDAAPELGHELPRPDSMTSCDESDDFVDAREELEADGTMSALKRSSGARASRSRSPRGYLLDTSTVAKDALDRKKQSKKAAKQVPARSPRTPGRTDSMGISQGITHGDVVSSRSNVSMMSDWDVYDGVGGFVKDSITGKTGFQATWRSRKDGPVQQRGSFADSSGMNSQTLDQMLCMEMDSARSRDGRDSVRLVSGDTVEGRSSDLRPPQSMRRHKSGRMSARERTQTHVSLLGDVDEGDEGEGTRVAASRSKPHGRPPSPGRMPNSAKGGSTGPLSARDAYGQAPAPKSLTIGSRPGNTRGLSASDIGALRDAHGEDLGTPGTPSRSIGGLLDRSGAPRSPLPPAPTQNSDSLWPSMSGMESTTNTVGSSSLPLNVRAAHPAPTLVQTAAALAMESPKSQVAPNSSVRAAPSRSMDGAVRLSNVPGEFRPMSKRGGRSSAAGSLKGAATDGGGGGGGGAAGGGGGGVRAALEGGGNMRALFDTVNQSENGSPRDRVGIADLVQKGWSIVDTVEPADDGHTPPAAPHSRGHHSQRVVAANPPRTRSDKPEKAAGGGARQANDPRRKAGSRRSPRRQQGAMDAALGADLADFGIKQPMGDASSDDSPLSMKALDISHAASSIGELTNSVVGMSGADGALPSAGDCTSTTTPTSASKAVSSASDIDLNPKQRPPTARQVTGEHSSGSDAGMPGPSASPAARPERSSKSKPAGSRTPGVEQHLHPLLRNNRAALQHVENLSTRDGERRSRGAPGAPVAPSGQGRRGSERSAPGHHQAVGGASGKAVDNREASAGYAGGGDHRRHRGSDT